MIPLLSVLMPVYNAEQFLRESIDSILNQSFEGFEFIIIDDGSTDNSLNIILSYSDSRIKIFKNYKNLGITATLNRGIDLANAEYIVRMDADDISLPNRLKNQFDFIQENSDGALYSCWAMEVTEDRKPIRIERFNPKHYYYNSIFSCWIYHPTMVFSRNAAISIGKYTDKYAEDFEFAWQLARKYKMYHLPEVLLEYRVTSQSLSHLKAKEYRESSRKQIARNINSYFEQNEILIEEWEIDLLSDNLDSKIKIILPQILKFIKTFNEITVHVLAKENVNKVNADILRAAKEKRKYMILSLLQKLSLFEGLKLLLFTKSWSLILKKLKERKNCFLKL